MIITGDAVDCFFDRLGGLAWRLLVVVVVFALLVITGTMLRELFW